MSGTYLPIYTTGAPGVPSVRVDPSPQVQRYSAYTGASLGYGPMKHGVISDAPQGHHNHGKPYHGGIQTTTADGRSVYMMHRLRPGYY